MRGYLSVRAGRPVAPRGPGSERRAARAPRQALLLPAAQRGAAAAAARGGGGEGGGLRLGALCGVCAPKLPGRRRGEGKKGMTIFRS